MTAGPRIGAEFAGYLVDSRLGRGGMSIVYLARSVRLGRRVALKIPTEELLDDPRFLERFVRESRLAAAIDHPNIIPIYEAGEVDGTPFIAMRYVSGTDLRRLIDAQAPMDPGGALAIIAQVADALDAAHREGLTHRDVKPANILLVPPSEPGKTFHAYLADFGLTKHATSGSGLTTTGQFVGTIDYVAPEQIEGGVVDGRTDEYSLACVLYECLVGQRVFAKDNDVAIMYAHLLEDPPRPAQHRQELPSGIDSVIARALAKKPNDRYATCSEMVAAARIALTPPPPVADPVVPPEPTRVIDPHEATRDRSRRRAAVIAAADRTVHGARSRVRAPALPHPLRRRPPIRWLLAAAGVAVVAALAVVFLVVQPFSANGQHGGGGGGGGGGSSLGADGPATSNTDGPTIVAQTLFPQAGSFGVGQPCGGPGDADYTSCPVTDRLAQRLQAHPFGDAVDSLCRCSNGYFNPSYSKTVTDSGGIAHVTLTLADGFRLTIDVVVNRTNDHGWQANDTMCSSSGGSTSIYASNPTTCG